MITGPCAPGKSPYITGFVHFPNPVNATIEVPFLLDTGAEWTTLSPLDLLKLGDQRPQLTVNQAPLEVRDASGGGFRPDVVHCGLAFVHANRSVSTFEVYAGVSPMAAAIAGVPSLLGMDVIAHGDVRLLSAARRVEFDPPAGVLITVTPPWDNT